MTTIHRSGLTLDEFLALPEEEPALEYFNGEVTQKVSPMGRHAVLQLRGANLINDFAVSRRLALALPELRGTFAGASRVPDIAVLRWARIPRTADGEIDNDQYIRPDIAIEILSPGQSLPDLAAKCRWYTANGVEKTLLIDDRRRSVTRFGAGGSEQRLTGDERIDLEPVLPGFSLTVAALFQTLRL